MSKPVHELKSGLSIVGKNLMLAREESAWGAAPNPVSANVVNGNICRWPGGLRCLLEREMFVWGCLFEDPWLDLVKKKIRKRYASAIVFHFLKVRSHNLNFKCH